MRTVPPTSATARVTAAAPREAAGAKAKPDKAASPIQAGSRPSLHVGMATVTENLLKRKWSATILRHLADGVMVPAEITRREPELTVAVMNERLRTLLRYALVTRTRRPAPAKDTEYQLTPRGQKTLQMLNLIDKLDQQPANFGLSMEEHFGAQATEANPDAPVQQERKPRRRNPQP